MTYALITELNKNKIWFEYRIFRGEKWLLLFDDTNELMLSVRYEGPEVPGTKSLGKKYIISDNGTRAIELGIHYEEEIDSIDEIIKIYYKTLL